MSSNYLFFIRRHYHIPLLQPLWEYIQEQGIGETGFFCGAVQKNLTGKGIPSDGLSAEQIRFLNKNCLKQIKDPYKYSPDISFMATNNYQWVEGLGRIVSIGHGTISKGLYFLPNKYSRRENIADLICVPGTIQKKRLSRTVIRPIIVTGIPKLDALFKKQSIQEMVEKYPPKFKKEHLTLLIAPTFNEELNLLKILDPLLDRYLSERLNIILKFHDFTPLDVKREYRKKALTSENIHFAESENIAQYFSFSDLLLTDVSSAAYEFKSIGKPVILYDNPLQKYYSGNHPDNLETQYRDIGLRFSKLSQFRKVFCNSLSLNKKDNLNFNKTAKQFVSVTDGSASRRVVQSAQKLIKSDRDYPVILIHQKGREEISGLLKRLGNVFPIMIFGAHIKGELPGNVKIFRGRVTASQAIQKACQRLPKNRLLCYLDAGFEFSPHLFRCFDLHFRVSSDIQILQPILGDIRRNKLQELRSMGSQLTYELPQELLSNGGTHPYCMAFRNNTRTLNAILKHWSFDSFGKVNKGIKVNVKVAMDTLIFRRKNNDSWKFDFNKYRGEQSLYHNILLLDPVLYGQGFTRKTFKKILMGKVGQDDLTLSTYYTDLGSAYTHLGEYTQAYEMFKTVPKYFPGLSKSAKGRYYYHRAIAEISLGMNKGASNSLKQCLKYSPDHRKAKECLASL